MKKNALVVVAIILVSCQPIATTNQSRQTKSDQDEYQEEAYPIGQQEEAYNKQNNSR